MDKCVFSCINSFIFCHLRPAMLHYCLELRLVDLLRDDILEVELMDVMADVLPLVLVGWCLSMELMDVREGVLELRLVDLRLLIEVLDVQDMEIRGGVLELGLLCC